MNLPGTLDQGRYAQNVLPVGTDYLYIDVSGILMCPATSGSKLVGTVTPGIV
jgi:hypothetical protein